MTLTKLTALPPLSALLPRRPYAGKSGFIQTASSQDLREAISDRNNVIAAIALWNAKSGYPGILTNGSSQLSNDGVYKYSVGDKSVVSPVRSGMIRTANYAKDEIRLVTAAMVRGEISHNDWYDRMRKIILIMLLGAWLLGIGGTDHYTTSDEDMFFRMADPQFQWLDNFANQINSGVVVVDGKLVSRAGQYGRSAYVIYQTAASEAARRNGYREGFRVLGENENHCRNDGLTDGCVELSALGWVDIDSIVPIGMATCRQNCLCHYIFRR